MDSHYTLLNMFNLLIIWKVVLVLFKIPILVHQISLWLTSLFVRILYNLAFSSVKAVSLHLSIWSSNDLSFFFFFVKLEILKQPYSNMHALSFFFLSRISCYFIFFKKSLIMIFQKKKKKERKIPLLLYATAKLGEMALAYLKVCSKKKKKKSMPRESS